MYKSSDQHVLLIDYTDYVVIYIHGLNPTHYAGII